MSNSLQKFPTKCIGLLNHCSPNIPIVVIVIPTRRMSLLAQSGHELSSLHCKCPLLTLKRTSASKRCCNSELVSAPIKGII